MSSSTQRPFLFHSLPFLFYAVRLMWPPRALEFRGRYANSSWKPSGGMATCEAVEEEDSSATAQLSAMFPNLEWELIQCVARMHDGDIEPAVNYLMAVVGDGGEVEHPFSEDIGGFPEIVSDTESLPSPPAQAVEVELMDSDSDEELPSYHDVVGDGTQPQPVQSFSLPPSYDSLSRRGTEPENVAGAESVESGKSHTQATEFHKQKRMHKLAYKLKTRKMRKMGYHNESQDHS